MSKNNIKDNLEHFKEVDVYSFILFALYKMSDLPEYSTLSELVYTMDRKSLFNFLECFGGTTIRVPTTRELKLVVNALLVYELVNIDNKDLNIVIRELDTQGFQISDILNVYRAICDLLKDYTFTRKKQDV